MIASPTTTKEKIAEKILTKPLKITGSSGGFITLHDEKLASKGKYTNPKSRPIIIGNEVIGHISLEKDEDLDSLSTVDLQSTA